jgi:hypothetical protein
MGKKRPTAEDQRWVGKLSGFVFYRISLPPLKPTSIAETRLCHANWRRTAYPDRAGLIVSAKEFIRFDGACKSDVETGQRDFWVLRYSQWKEGLKKN